MNKSVLVRSGLWRGYRGGLLLIAAIALALRMYGMRYGLPAVYNPDEVAIMSRALAFAKGDLNPHNFLYPSFYFYALFAWEGLTALVAVAMGAMESVGAFQREFFLDPTRVFVAGRLLTALIGAATATATAVLTARISGRAVGLIAGLLLAVAPLHVLNSHYVKHDVPVTLLVILAYLAYERLWTLPRKKDLPPEGGSYRSLLVAAALTGIAFSTHYYAIFLAIPLAWSAARGAATGAEAIKRVAIAAIVSAVVFFALSPFILIEPATAIRDVLANRQIVVDRAVENLGYVRSAARYGKLLLLDTVGAPCAVLAAIGIVIGVRRDPIRTAWLLSFAAPFLLFIAGTFPASRYLVPVVPFMALFAGQAIAEFGSIRVGPTLLAPILLTTCVVPAALESCEADRFITQTDTRTLALRFITTHVPSGATILTQPYSVPIESTAGVLREAVERSGKEMPTKTRLQIERTPYPSPAYRIIYLGYGLDADKLYLPIDQLGGADPLQRLRREHVAFVVLKRYNGRDPATLPFLAALAREGRRIAVFSPYRNAAEPGNGPRAEPFLHNTDVRIVAALERPGPTVEIWQIDGPGS